MNKYAFISDLLEKETLNHSQKERVINLVLNELKSDGINQNEIEERINQIEKIIKVKDSLTQQEFDENEISSEEKLPEYIDPEQHSKFLKAYNQNNLLKYTCHRIDYDGLNAILKECEIDEFNIAIFQYNLIKSYKKLVSKHNISKRIYALIYAYLNGGNEWSADNIKINWNNQQLLDWCADNLCIVPNPGDDLISQTNNLGFEFPPFKSRIFGNQVRNFSELVIHFKNLFHLRRDNSLMKIIENVNLINGWQQVINFDFSNFIQNIEFFTDVDKLLQAYVKIIKIILEVSSKEILDQPKVVISLSESSETILFSIHHVNSVYGKTIKNTIERIGNLHNDLIENQINGLCDLYIQADFGNNHYAKINLWNGEERKFELLEKFIGVEYHLIFK